METFDFQNLLEAGTKRDVPTILTIGVFDGFHLAHQALVREMVELQRKIPDAETMVVTFSTNPKPGKERNLDTLRTRTESIAEFGINSFVVIDFSKEFSRISSGGFIDMLISLCNPVAVVVGDDFRFGNPMSASTAADLKELFAERGLAVEVIIKQAILTEGGEKISSTLVRRVIDNGQMECIFPLIGRSYRIDLEPIPYEVDSGDVVICRKFIHQLLPPPGVYEARLEFQNRKERVNCQVSEEFLRIRGANVTSGTEGKALDGKQLNSIYFGEEK